MKKTTKRPRRTKQRTKTRTNHVKTLGRALALGELDQIYGGNRPNDPGTKG